MSAGQKKINKKQSIYSAPSAQRFKNTYISSILLGETNGYNH